MGSIFARHILQREQPKIGLMNVGSEEEKGHSLAKETHDLFTSSHLKPQFIGNVEGRDVPRGMCDVVVTDGFVGNVVLKVCEGVFEFTVKMMAKELQTRLSTEREAGLAAVQELVSRYDYHEHGGAPLLGIDGICIICHGSSGEKAIKNAIGMASRFVKAKLNSLIVQELSAVPMVGAAEESN
jgi:glycerol-3-phosphate acyltransferase PlsX